MDRMLYLAMNGAKHVMWQQATTANNLANVHTNGFKADVVAFRALPVVGEGAPTRTYVVDNTVGHDLSQGSLMHTGNTSDFAIGSKGFSRCKRRMAVKLTPATAVMCWTPPA